MQQVPTFHPVDTDVHPFVDKGEWFLLREDVEVDGVVYKAGTPVRRTLDRWFACGSRDPLSGSLDGRTCRAEYGGLSLHVVSCGADGVVSHRRIGSDEPPEIIPASRVISPPEQGRDKVYLSFGDQFYPLEYFGW
jgi:hypothetical protein